MSVAAEQIKRLREQTGAGIKDCRDALEKTGGDLEQAAALLRAQGLTAADKRADRATRNGVVELYRHGEGRVGVMVEVNCETDFVARTPEFGELVRNLAMQVAAAGAEFVRREEVPAERVEKEKEIFAAQLAREGKPAQIIDKIVAGKLDKFFAEIVLLEQPYIKDDKRTVGELVQEAAAKTGENIVVRRFARFRLGAE